jgi:hypothetical protein
MHRLAEKAKIGVEQWRGYAPEEVKQSRLFSERPKTEHLKAAFGEFVVKDRDFKVFTLPKGTWEAGAEERARHQEEVQRMRAENLKTIKGEAGRPKSRPIAQVPPSVIEGKTDLEWDIESEPDEMAKDRKFKHKRTAPPTSKTKTKRKGRGRIAPRLLRDE